MVQIVTGRDVDTASAPELVVDPHIQLCVTHTAPVLRGVCEARFLLDGSVPGHRFWDIALADGSDAVELVSCFGPASTRAQASRSDSSDAGV